MVPLDVRHDAGHVDLALESRRLARLGSHVVHYVLNVGLPACFDYNEESIAMISRTSYRRISVFVLSAKRKQLTRLGLDRLDRTASGTRQFVELRYCHGSMLMMRLGLE